MITAAAAETEEGVVPEEPLSGNEPLEAATLNAEVVVDDDDDTLTLKEIRCRRFSHKVASLLSSSAAVGDGNTIIPKTGTTGLPPFLRSYGSTSKREERLMHYLQYAARFCDRGVKIEKYLKATLEEFSVGSQPDGMVQRVTRFKDMRMRIPVMITEIFKQRKDSLQTRVKYLGDAAIREEFGHGRSSALKVLVNIDERVRIMEYYHEGRADRLQRTVEKIGEKIKEYFIDRDDMLEYHSVKLDRELMGSVVGKSLPSLPI
ncbi:hypothetical protein Pmar_PMAR013000, partial [Perkinsus marinus ATCC 50983]